jgi:hypothetical protein
MATNVPATSATLEWRSYGYLPLIAALGYSMAGLHVFGIGPLMEPLQQEFGWTRKQILGGSALVSLIAVLA